MVSQHAKAAEVELEIRAQIDRAIKAGIRPTHVDSHMGTLFTPEFFAVYVKVAHEYGLPYLAMRLPTAPAAMLTLIQNGDIIPDAIVMASETEKNDAWPAYYAGVIRSLKPGLTELIVHLGHDDAELQAVTVDHQAYGSAWRQRDFEVITGATFRQTLLENHVTLIGWKEIQEKQYARH